MKKNSQLRLRLHRETLGNLTPDQMGAAQGGNASNGCLTQSCYRTCGCVPVTLTCATLCGGACSATSQTC